MRQLGHQRYRRRARSDHDDLFVRVVEILGPELGVDGVSLEVLESGDGGGQRRVVVVVPGAEDEEAGGQERRLASVDGDAERPEGIFRGPRRRGHRSFVLDLFVDAVLRRRLLHVLLDGRAVGDGVLLVPGIPGEAERDEVRVGSNSRVPKEIPRAAHARSSFEDGVAVAGELGL